MELRHLRYFVAVAEAGSVTRAAERLGIQQPPLSQQIAALEAEIGVSLFDRSARRLTLNDAGRLFLEGARRTLAEAQDAAEAVRRFDRGEQGRLTLGATSSALLHPLTPRLIAAHRARYPHMQVEVEEGENYALVLALQARHIDAAFLRIPVARFPALESLPLAEEEVLTAVPAGHALAQRRDGVLDLAELAEVPVVLYRRPDGHGIHDALMASFARRGFTPRVVDEVRRMLTALTLVAAGRGVAFVPASMQVLHPGLIAYLRAVGDALPRLPLNLAYRREGTPRMVQNLAEVMRTALGQPGPGGSGLGKDP